MDNILIKYTYGLYYIKYILIKLKLLKLFWVTIYNIWLIFIFSEIKNISVIIQISVKSLRILHTTIKDFVSNISNNLIHNIAKIANSSWSALDTTDEITRQLVLQSKGTIRLKADTRGLKLIFKWLFMYNN